MSGSTSPQYGETSSPPAQLDRVAAAVTADADRLTHALHLAWQHDRPAAAQAAQTVCAGAGPLGIHRGRTRRATRDLEARTDTWRPVLPTLPSDAAALAGRVPHIDSLRLHQAITSYARHTTEQAHPAYR